MKEYINRHKILFSFLITGIQFLLVFFAISFVFHADEYHAEISLSGDYFGAYAKSYPFINALFSRGLIVLYKLFGNVPWYSVFDLVFLFISFVAIHYSYMSVLLSKKVPLAVIESSYSLIFCIILLPNLSNISFTPIAGFLSIAGICLLFTKFAEKDNYKKQRIFSVVFIVFSFILRSSSCFVGLCFYVLTLIVIELLIQNDAINRFKDTVKTSAPAFMTLIVIFASLSALALCNNLLRSTDDAKDVLKWNSVRSRYFDYYDKDSYEKDKAFFDSIGYDENFFPLAYTGWLFDEKCDYNHLSKISDYMDETTPKMTIKSTVSALISGVVENIQNRKLVPLLLGVFILFIAYLVLIFKKGKNKILLPLFYLLSVASGTVILCLYLCYVGRFRYHVFRLCLCPAFFCLLFADIILLPDNIVDSIKPIPKAIKTLIAVLSSICPIVLLFVLKRYFESGLVYYACVFTVFILAFACILIFSKPGKRHLGKTVIIGILTFAFALCACLSMRIICYNTADYMGEQEQLKTIDDYLTSNRGAVYIAAFPSKVDIRNIATNSDSLSHVFYSFDYMQFSKVYQNKLEINNRDNINFKSLAEDNVYFISYSGKDFNLLKSYLSDVYNGNLSVETVNKLENDVTVYKFKH